ncbi:M15 family metallopeptidase [Marinomonas sp. THO17]|uniref:M15 family metallopeptidase n=1 Tax=Marinomonas sp. THO17 TaxID=3149048 RepID=UPI00336BFA79
MIPIQENNEPLEPVSLANKLKMYPAYYKLRVANALPECFVRSSVLDRLNLAATFLPGHLYLVVLDGWRPFSVQQYLFDSLTNLLTKSLPDLPLEKVRAKARTLVSPPSDNPETPSPHLTGGSVDVTLCDQNGRFLNMGTLFDEASDDSWTAALENKTSPDKSTQVAIQNRRMLFHAMTQAGFTNLPSEWWHYDFGNQLWAINKGERHALYGVTSITSIEQGWKEQLAR